MNITRHSSNHFYQNYVIGTKSDNSRVLIRYILLQKSVLG
jgi:hypothetical protein